MNIKSGIKTSEFWLTLFVTVIGMAVYTGYMPQDIADQALKGLEQIIGGILTLVPVITFIIGRSAVKIKAIEESSGEIVG